MLNQSWYILCKHLIEDVRKNKPLDRHIELIAQAVDSHQFDVVDEDLVVDTLPDQV